MANSGGIDSMVLTDLLSKLDYQITLAHCNFHLRGKESNLDEAFVVQTAKSLKIPFHVISFDTKEYAKEKNISIQMAARDLRYEWFEELLQNHDLDFLLTAHHADDNLETFLINFSRGTGLEGLTGIPAINHKTIRTLLPFSRKEIEHYAKENEISWREDQSNKETKYVRNKLRHELIPLLKELNPRFLESFRKTMDHLDGSNQLVKDRIKEVKAEIQIKDRENSKFKIHDLKLLNNPKAYLYELLKEYGFSEWNDVLSLLNAQTGKQVISKTHRLLKDREYLILSPLSIENNTLKKYEIDISATKFVINNISDIK
ncbi:MAG: tRNA lysidine(34) synthetase TilS, partial [Flavobacteriaceae bacterium]|nr:tRNA lysidine(34) synthetase TilS [Flavobacteriaceae bacterium]